MEKFDKVKDNQHPTFSILLTSAHELKTIASALNALLDQKLPGVTELLIVSPDKEVDQFLTNYAESAFSIRHILDEGHGKPAAINLGLAEAKGQIVILTDGDVRVEKGALADLVRPFANPKIGAVGGRPIPINSRKTMLGYWSHFLTNTAHQLRLMREQSGQFFDCSGYLYAVRRRLIRSIPEDTLADDALTSGLIWKQGTKIAYVPEAVVYVKFPTTVTDWLRQKVRTIAAYNQPALRAVPVMRSFFQEASGGVWRALTFAKTLRELWWTLLLFGLRIYVWAAAWFEINLRHRSPSALWKRVETTK